jgi:thiamine biosynthesis protein ThiS
MSPSGKIGTLRSPPNVLFAAIVFASNPSLLAPVLPGLVLDAGPKQRRLVLTMNLPAIIANGQKVEAQLPCSIEQFLLSQKLLPRSVVVELNGEAIAPSEFSQRQLMVGDRLEIVKIVAGG